MEIARQVFASLEKTNHGIFGSTKYYILVDGNGIDGGFYSDSDEAAIEKFQEWCVNGKDKAKAKEFCRDLLGTLKEKGMINQFRSAMEIAIIMGISIDKANEYIDISCENNFMQKSIHNKETYKDMPILYEVIEIRVSLG